MSAPELTPAWKRKQAAVIASGSALACYLFARTVPGADVAALQAVVIASGSADDCHWFARNVPGADIEALLAAAAAKEAA